MELMCDPTICIVKAFHNIEPLTLTEKKNPCMLKDNMHLGYPLTSNRNISLNN